VLAHAAIANTTAPTAAAFPSLEIFDFTSTFLLLLSYTGMCCPSGCAVGTEY
jgi:hypothetical protein